MAKLKLTDSGVRIIVDDVHGFTFPKSWLKQECAKEVTEKGEIEFTQTCLNARDLFELRDAQIKEVNMSLSALSGSVAKIRRAIKGKDLSEIDETQVLLPITCNNLKRELKLMKLII